MNKTARIIATLSLAALSGLALADNTATPRVDQREARQQERIANGAASGQLTAKETQRLEKQQAHINATEASAKADGKVTAKERRRLDRMQDRASKDIRAEKHDAKTAN